MSPTWITIESPEITVFFPNEGDESLEPQKASGPGIPWRYGQPGEVIIPHAALNAATVRLLSFAEWYAADAEATIYRITPQLIAKAIRQGYSDSQLWALLERQAGPVPPEWSDALGHITSPIQIRYTAVVMTDEPQVLDRAAQGRSVRRYLQTRLAPGIALVEPA